MEISIRQAEKNDLQSILGLYSQADMDNGNVLDLEKAGSIFDRIKSYPDYNIYVAIYNGSIAGTFALAIMDNLAHMGTPSGLIEDVVVSSEFQDRGIGTQMMKFAINVCKEKGCYKVSLSSNLKRTNAHRFYEKLGFKKHGYSYLIEL